MKAKVPMPYNKAALQRDFDTEVKRMKEAAWKSMEEEIRSELAQQVATANADYELELDALVLWTLHTRFGFGYRRLSEFYEALFQERKELHDRYLPSHPEYTDNGVESDVAYQKLRDYGYDVKTHYAELTKKYPITLFPEEAE